MPPILTLILTPILRLILAPILLAALLASPLLAETSPDRPGACHGQNLIAALPPEQLAALQEAATAQPFARGNLWRARRAGQEIVLAGTYHLNDPRLAPILDRLAPEMERAKVLLVEAGPVEEQALKARMMREPSLMIAPGPSLAERLAPADWQALSGALQARGILPAMVSRLQPWLLAPILAVPACAFPLSKGFEAGLDKQLMARAQNRGLPIRALEPYDTLLAAFATIPAADQLEMIRQSALIDARGEDLSRTLSDSYFAGESRLYWLFLQEEAARAAGRTPQEMARDGAAIDAALITARNRAWIRVLEAEAQDGPVLAGFGALHLSGAEGVLALLAQNGWSLSPLDP